MRLSTALLVAGLSATAMLGGFVVVTQQSDMDNIQSQYISTVDGSSTRKYLQITKRAETVKSETTADSANTSPPSNSEPTIGADGLTYGNGGNKVPLYLQGDPQWGDYWPADHVYGTSLSVSGCGYTSLAMAISYATGTTVLPTEIADKYCRTHHTASSGISWSAFTAAPPDYGLKVQAIGHDINALAEGLKQGKVAVASNVPGSEPDRFSTGGHIICIRGVDENGNFLVNNPNSRGMEQLNLPYPPEKMQNYIKQEWLIWKE